MWDFLTWEGHSVSVLSFMAVFRVVGVGRGGCSGVLERLMCLVLFYLSGNFMTEYLSIKKKKWQFYE